MKLCVLLMFVFSFTVVANTHAQQEKVNLDLKNVSIKMLFGKIQKQTALSFVFNTELTKDFGRISVKADNEAVESVLRRVLANTGLTYRFEGDIIVIRQQELSTAQQEVKKEITIVGKVVDEKKVPIPGVTILLKGTSLGTGNKRGRKLQVDDSRYERCGFDILVCWDGDPRNQVCGYGYD